MNRGINTSKELYKEMKSLYNKEELKELTLEAAKSLKGKRIKTLYMGYMGQDEVDNFIVGDVVSEYNYYLNCPSETEDRFPDEKGNKNLIDYWKSRGFLDLIEESKKTLYLLDSDGYNTMFRLHAEEGNNTFTCSDVDRIVYYKEA